MDRLVAYTHLNSGVRESARVVLETHAQRFAEREGYDLLKVLTGSEDCGGPLSLRQLIEQVEAYAADAVLVVGPARDALVALRRFAGVEVVTLAHVGPGPVFPRRPSRNAGWDL